MSQTLICSKCKTVKPVIMFYKNHSRKTGYSSYCKACDNSLPRKQYLNGVGASPTKYIKSENRRKYSRAMLRRFYNYPNQCKRRKKKIDFNLTLEQFADLTSQPCHYCGQLSPSKDHVGIDRVDSNGDYTPDNCVPCCSVCNLMKCAWSHTFFVSHAAKITEYQTK